MWHEAKGTLQYSFDPIIGPKLIALTDQQIVKYYRSLIPKHIRSNGLRYPAHVSVVRKYRDVNMEYWGKHEGVEISFEYSNEVGIDETYLWLPVRSYDLTCVRRQLGLPDRPEWTNAFHITVGNFKDV